jgi:hypothetical protein
MSWGRISTWFWLSQTSCATRHIHRFELSDRSVAFELAGEPAALVHYPIAILEPFLGDLDEVIDGTPAGPGSEHVSVLGEQVAELT